MHGATSRFFGSRWVVAATAAVCVAQMAGAGNLIPDPEFKNAALKPLTPESSWRWYQINGPSDAVLDAAQGTLELTGGKTFLHSSRFEVTPGAEYSVSVSAQGSGKLSLEMLWWTKAGGGADPHRAIPLDPTDLSAEFKEFKATAKAPDDAAEAYMRVVVSDGKAVVRQPAAAPAQ